MSHFTPTNHLHPNPVILSPLQSHRRLSTHWCLLIGVVKSILFQLISTSEWVRNWNEKAHSTILLFIASRFFHLIHPVFISRFAIALHSNYVISHYMPFYHSLNCTSPPSGFLCWQLKHQKLSHLCWIANYAPSMLLLKIY